MKVKLNNSENEYEGFCLMELKPGDLIQLTSSKLLVLEKAYNVRCSFSRGSARSKNILVEYHPCKLMGIYKGGIMRDERFYCFFSWWKLLRGNQSPISPPECDMDFFVTEKDLPIILETWKESLKRV